MFILKTKKETLSAVLKHQKHASDTELKNAINGDIILISQTKDSLSDDEKSIKYSMKFKRCYKDSNNESNKIWGKHWKYIIEGYNVKPLSIPFNIEDIQVSNKNYAPVVTHCRVDPLDEKEVLKYL